MTTYAVVVAKHATTSGSTADTVRLLGTWRTVEVINRDETDHLYCKIGRHDQGTITAEADDTIVIPPRKVLVHEVSAGGGQVWVSLVGSTTPYSVQGVD